MAERTKERSDEEQSTEDLLSETDALLDGLGDGADGGTGTTGSSARRNASEHATVPDVETETDRASGQSLGSRSSRLSGLVPKRSPVTGRGLLVTLLLVTAGAFAGGTFLPILGTSLGMFAAAFGLGLVRSRRAYLESALSGAAVGGTLSFLTNLQFALWTGAGVPIAALGAGSGLLAVVLGLYFGRDLRAGLTKDIGGD